MGAQTATQQPEARAGTGDVDVEEARSFVNVGKEEAKSAESIEDPSEKKDNYFLLKASTFSVWLPSVVGNIRQCPKMFLRSSMTSLAAKVVTLTTAVVLAEVGLQEQIQPNHSLLLCRDNPTLIQSNNQTNIIYCTSWEDCFNSTSKIQQKIRVCGDSETSFRLYLLLGLTVSTLLALLATLKLHKISDYEKLFQDSKTFLLLPTQPVVHRKLLVDTVEKNNTTLLEDILNSHAKKTAYDYMMALFNNVRKSQEEPVDYLDNRANPQGNMPLHISCMKGYSDCTEKLIKAGVDVNIPDQDHRTALQLAWINCSVKCYQLLIQDEAIFYSNSDGVKYDIFGEDPNQANSNHLTEWQEKQGLKHTVENPSLAVAMVR